jgi:uncharacterized protein (TIGR03118 family)
MSGYLTDPAHPQLRTPRHRPVLVAGVAVLAAVAAAVIPTDTASAHGEDGGAYQQVNLVSDQPGVAPVTDPVNAWGMSQGPTTPVWVSDNGTDVSTLYTEAGPGGRPAAVPLVVAVPGGAPTGQVFNPGPGFELVNKKPARFIFAGEHGEITAWNPQLTPNTSAVQVATVPGGSLKGMALLSRPYRTWLLLADFANNRVVALDSAFHAVALRPGAFSDRRLPAGYAPFNIAVLGKRVFVSYALRNPVNGDDVAGPGNGFIDTYSADGMLLRRFARRGALNAPWGMAIAPPRFGEFSGDLLVGNFGDGRINAFDPRTGERHGALRARNGKPIVIDGLWGLLPGNGTSAAANEVWFSAGPSEETHGLLGVLRAAPDDHVDADSEG